MTQTNRLVESPPHPVAQSLQQLGSNLRTARIRRGLTIADAAERIGTGPRAVMDAEKGKPATGIVVYAALLWMYDQLSQLDEVAEPANDRIGVALAGSKGSQRAVRRKGLDNDF